MPQTLCQQLTPLMDKIEKGKKELEELKDKLE
jgi:hypothetical protein